MSRGDGSAHHRRLADRAVAAVEPFPAERHRGRGIVICGGGRRYFPSAWVTVRMLRARGATLPIQLWYLGEREVDAAMAELLAPYDVTCVDAWEVARRHPMRRLGGYEAKPFAVAFSPFEEVVLLDADNVPLIDPAALFEHPEYRRTGALFWPDYHPISRHNGIWEVCGVPFRFEPSFESGQMVIDKRRCWDALALTLHYNAHSDVYYRFLGGDKDTFHLAWRRLDRAYGMTPWGVRDLGGRVMLQHDFDGRVIFQHRNLAKWRLPRAENPRIDGFEAEEECLSHLAELEESWSGVVQLEVELSPPARRLFDQVAETRHYVYERVGHDRRILELRPDQSIGEGRAALETCWHVVGRPDDGAAELQIGSDGRLTCRLDPQEGGWFSGRWEEFERMPVILSPLAELPPEERRRAELDGLATRLVGRWYCLVRVGVESRFVRLRAGGRLGGVNGDGAEDAGGAHWRLEATRDGGSALRLVAGGREALLVRGPDTVWRSPAAAGVGEGDAVELVPVPELEPE